VNSPSGPASSGGSPHHPLSSSLPELSGPHTSVPASPSPGEDAQRQIPDAENQFSSTGQSAADSYQRPLHEREISAETSINTVQDEDPEPAQVYDPSLCIRSENKLSEAQLQRRDRIITERQKAIQELRDLKAQEWLHERAPTLLKALTEPEFAQRVPFKILLAVGDRVIQLVPQDPAAEVSPEVIDRYANDVRQALEQHLSRPPRIGDIQEDISFYKSWLNDARKELQKLGVKINTNVQTAFLSNIQVVLDLTDGKGVVSGESTAPPIPDAALTRLPRRPDIVSMHIKTEDPIPFYEDAEEDEEDEENASLFPASSLNSSHDGINDEDLDSQAGDSAVYDD